MKGLRKYLTPFAPDQSGAVGVLYELGGLLVVCDAGGCAGNICGFDEPRWATRKSAVFSAGLRDMDAILGRDDRLVDKLASAAEKLDASFAAIIGTPVPSVIGTDYRALRRMAERRISLPILTVNTTGMALYDAGEEKAYDALFRAFALERFPVEKTRLGVLGATPLNLSRTDAGEHLAAALSARGWETVDCYGMGAGLARIRTASAAAKNLVVAPSALSAARYLQERFGTPYEVCDPLAEALLPERDYAGRRALVVHQQVTANSLRTALLRRGCASVTVASWFRLDKALAAPGDLALREEDEFAALVQSGQFDLIVGDPELRQLAAGFEGEFVDTAHFALSGRLAKG